MTEQTSPLRIDIISDVMCPWCLIGYRQLAIALKAKAVPHEIYWHPFELNPGMPAEGQDLREHLAEKYGTTPAQSKENRARLSAIGDELGVRFEFAEAARMHNTFNSHQLLHWADAQGGKHDLKQALFVAHFTDGRDLSDTGVLADIAAEIGMDRSEAAAVLADQRFGREVRKEQALWVQQGIQGVPAVVFDNKHLVTGAQGVDAYSNILDQLAQMRA